MSYEESRKTSYHVGGDTHIRAHDMEATIGVRGKMRPAFPRFHHYNKWFRIGKKSTQNQGILPPSILITITDRHPTLRLLLHRFQYRQCPLEDCMFKPQSDAWRLPMR